MSKFILGYWDVRGFGEAIRYMLEYLEVDYKDRRTAFIFLAWRYVDGEQRTVYLDVNVRMRKQVSKVNFSRFFFSGDVSHASSFHFHLSQSRASLLILNISALHIALHLTQTPVKMQSKSINAFTSSFTVLFPGETNKLSEKGGKGLGFSSPHSYVTESFSFQNLTTDASSLVIYVAPHGMYVKLRSSCASTLHSVLQVTGSIPGLGIGSSMKGDATSPPPKRSHQGTATSPAWFSGAGIIFVMVAANLWLCSPEPNPSNPTKAPLPHLLGLVGLE
ncbi:unnamed protein product [Clavelina lepadiformis]|uniref:GST N-terminal domain-containing protein n=1 Tax=Clavelina lepadiformis TaxID=159417 RepID=A0ABP0FWG5_CLALP